MKQLSYKIFTSLFALTLFAILIGCYNYNTPPAAEIKKEPDQIVINKSFDETWEAILEYNSTSYIYKIVSSDKDSGQLTITFESYLPGDYIDCGIHHDPFDTHEIANSGARYKRFHLDGRMTVTLKSETPYMTKVSVTTRYKLKGSRGSGFYFDSNTSYTAKGVTCVSNDVAETEYLDTVKDPALKVTCPLNCPPRIGP